MEVKRHGKILRLLLIENFKQNIQESIYGVRVQSFCIGQIRYAVKSPVQNTVSVQSYDFITHNNPFSQGNSITSK